MFGLFVAVTFKMVTGGVTAAATSVATITVGVGLLGVVVGIINSALSQWPFYRDSGLINQILRIQRSVVIGLEFLIISIRMAAPIRGIN